MSFVKGERITHISATDIKSNGIIESVHFDDGHEYYTLLLDDGREIQTVGSRLKKGEFTGVGNWQRLLDPQTECYFFFDDVRKKTLWDTPEAREIIFDSSQEAKLSPSENYRE